MSIPNAQKKALIVGLPNSGKSQLFTWLTGCYAEVANAPLTTIDLRFAPMACGQGRFEIIDSPGMQDLFSSLNTSQALRDALIVHKPDALVLCVDGNRVTQSLALGLELQTLGLPMVLALLFHDDAQQRGVAIDIERLAWICDAPVVLQRGSAKDLEKMAAALETATPGRPKHLVFPKSLTLALGAIEAALPPDFPYPRAASLHLLLCGRVANPYFGVELDPSRREALLETVVAAALQVKGPPHSVVSNVWNGWIDLAADKVLQVHRKPERDGLQVVAQLTRSLVFGPLILIMILFMTFLLVADGANSISEWMYHHLWAPVHVALAGILPQGFWSDLLIGDYGVISMGLANALLTVLPILTVFYLVFNTLEDVGYLPNLSVLTRRILGKLGLSGTSIMPLVLGFGCKTMATLTAKTLTSRKEKFITIFLIAFAIPCASQMGLNMSIIGRMKWTAFIFYAVAVISVAFIAGLLLNKVLHRSEAKDPFILELPPIRLPEFKAVVKKTYYRVFTFLKESLSVFVYAALGLFFLDRIGLLGVVKVLLAPVVVGMLGLPTAMIDALILLLARHEAAAAVIIDLIRKGQLDFKQCIVAVTLTTLFVPCFANIMAMGRVLGGKDAALILVSVNIFALGTAGALNWLLTAMAL